ncbi:U-scoloptoxin(19)-Sm1a [Aethina tumida]|uniref:U-scoloptoxin(19)-Sm1a n=1 Tax=Aethina tumida TaxID=116153 RepID=UPI00096B1A88|nr:U-scoloptoxin(19)-Sm1a [Aethina tumida]
MVRVLFCFAALVLVASSELESNFYREEVCASKGGYCLTADECPTKNLSEELESACPTQKSLGAVCCPNYTGDLNCYQTHNSCRPSDKCKKDLILGKKGCKGDKICCTLV